MLLILQKRSGDLIDLEDSVVKMETITGFGKFNCLNANFLDCIIQFFETPKMSVLWRYSLNKVTPRYHCNVT